MNADLKNVITEYVDAAQCYGERIREGDSRGSDKYFDKVERAFVKIRAHGERGLDELAKVLQHEEESVRLWASSHLLNYPKYRSLSVLKAISESKTVLGLTAEVTLDQWRSGNVKY